MARKYKRTSVSEIKENKSTEVKSEQPSDISIRSRKSARIIMYGKVSGRKYVFEGAGSVVSIDSRDAEELLSKKTPRSCCGSLRQGYVFELVE